MTSARPAAVAAVAALGLAGLAGCSSTSAAQTPVTSPMSVSTPAGAPAAATPVAQATASTGAAAATGRPSAAASAAARASSGALATTTPGLHLQGPQPLPAQQRVTPTRVQIPAIGVDSTLQGLHTVAGVLQPPTDPLRAGWWTGGAVPGDPGPAVIAGHLDSFTGPAVFIDLGALKAGDTIRVSRSDGRTVTFVVDAVQTYSKSAFPSAAVYGPTPGAALRLITCGGTYDRAKQVYLANVIVFASPQA